MPIVAAVVIAAGALYGSISAADAKKKGQEAARDAMAQIAAQYNGIVPPEVKELAITELKKQGVYTPEIEQSMDVGESNWKDFAEDTNLKNAQQGALQQMIGVSRTGMQASDRAALNKIRNEGARDTEAKRQQIIQQMQARGQGGGGAELASQLLASQAGSDQASEQADRQAAQAQQNALRAIADSSSMAAQGRQSDLSAASAKNNSMDEMQRFNVSQQQQVAQRNVANRNQAQAANLQESQRVYEQNVANKHTESLRQESAKQERFKNEMDLARAKAAAMMGRPEMEMKAGEGNAKSQAQIGNGIGSIGSAFGGMGGMGGMSSSNPQSIAGGQGEKSSMNGSTVIAAHGGRVPGQAKVAGDSPVNDTVHAMLSPGEIVVPRSKATSPEKAKDFVEKATKGDGMPSDSEIAHHIIKSNSALHAILTRSKKGSK